NESEVPEVLWQPDPATVADTKIARFRSWLAEQRDVRVTDYHELWHYSTTSIADFWDALAEYLGVIWHDLPDTVLSGSEMPGVRWFAGSTLNYAEHALRGGVAGATKADDEPAVLFCREDGREEQLTYAQLRSRVAAFAAALRSYGVGKGDRVVAL